MRLAELRMSVRPGNGLVARFPAAVLVVTSTDWAELPSVDRLLEECGGPGSDRSLPLRLAVLVDDTDPQKLPSFCAVADSDDGLAFYVHGDAQVVITGAQPVVRLSGQDASGWTGRIHDQVASLAIGPAGGLIDAIKADQRADLREGVVPGSSVVLVPRDQAAAAPTPPAVHTPAPLMPAPAAPTPPAVHTPAPLMPAPAAAPPVEPVPEPAPPSVVTAAAPASAAIAGPAAATPPGVAAAAVDGEPPMVWGIHCKRGHFNNPDARYCRMCGTHMVHQRRDPVLGPRPVLGFLVVDDGSTYKLDVDYVIGRQPELGSSVIAGDARGLALSDPEDTVSPVHTGIHLDQWDVFVSDLGSRYGTHIWTPGSAGWVRLTQGEKVALEPRTHVLLGRRSIVFDSVNRR